MRVAVTIAIRGKSVALDKVQDSQVRASLQKAGDELGRKLEPLYCEEHKRGVRDVKLHFDAKGNGDIRFDMCCEKLGEKASKVL